VRQAIEARGAKLLYPPPYSPDLALGPQHRRGGRCGTARRLSSSSPSAAAHGRNQDRRRPQAAIGPALDAFSPAECVRCLAHAGYAPSDRNALVCHERRHGHVVQDGAGDAPEHELAQARVAVGAHHQKIAAAVGDVR
jgi:hypothetical protein